MVKQMSSKPIVDQIVDLWFSDLESRDEFGGATIERLKRLASQRTLDKHSKVTEAIAAESGGAR